MIGHITIRERGPTPRKMRKAWTQSAKGAWASAAAHWHSEIMPKHFKRSAYFEYSYTPRRPSYEAAKQRLFGHRLPLVYTGGSRSLARMRQVSSTSKGARLTVHAPKLRLVNPKSRVRPAEELRRFSRRDQDAIAKEFDGSVDTNLARFQETATERI